MARVGAHPDTAGLFGGRKLPPETLDEHRRCVVGGGPLALWNEVEEQAREEARRLGTSIEEYYNKVRSEG